MREVKFTDQKSLSISSLQTEYINPYSSSGCGKNSERGNLVNTKCTCCGGANHYAKTFSKISERKRKKLVRLVIWRTKVQNVRLGIFKMWI